MNQDLENLEKLINEIVEQRVNERLRQQRGELLQVYKDLVAYKKSTCKVSELVHPLYLVQGKINDLIADFNTALHELAGQIDYLNGAVAKFNNHTLKIIDAEVENE